MENERENNAVLLIGTAAGEAGFSHRSRERCFYTLPLAVRRLSGTEDRLNLLLDAGFLRERAIFPGARLGLRGELRSFNNHSGQGSRLVLSVFVRELWDALEDDANEVCLTGSLCKPPNFRRTPMGREICDLMLAVRRKYGRSDYLPCIAWGANARMAADWAVGSAVGLTGRIQSRAYQKIIDGVPIEKTAYEVSVIALSQDE